MNSTDLLAFSTRAAATGAELWPASVLIAGETYTATVPEPRVIGSLINGGEILEGTLTARVLVADLSTAPAANQQLQWKRPADATWRPEKWWIDDVKRSPLDVEWYITCSIKN